MTAVLDRKVLRHEYTPRGAALQLFKTKTGEVLLSGPAGTGKSRACLEKMHATATMNARFRGLVLRKTQKSLTSTGLVTFKEKVLPEAIAARQVKWFGGSALEAAGYRYSNGSFIAVGGLDNSDKIMSSEYDMIYIQEATEVSEGDWEDVTSRKRNGRVSFQQLIADCNPGPAHHWLKRRADNGQTTMLESRHEDNPLFFDDAGRITDAGRAYIEGVLDKLTGVRYLRLRKGIWAAAEGLVYDDYDPIVHLADELPDGAEHWTRYWSIDFGFSNPFVAQWWAEDPDGGLWLYREIYMTGRLVEDHARQILSLVRKPRPDLKRAADPAESRDWEWTEPEPQAIICDHDAEDRATLERHLGMATVAARKAPKAGQRDLVGLQQTQARFKKQGNGRVRIRVLRDALVERDATLVKAALPSCWAEEVVGYVWPADVKPDQREHPVKKDDHAMDAMRYMVGHVDLGSDFGLRFW